MKVAVLGTGMIGSALAEAFLQVGYEVVVYNRTTAKTDALVKKGASAAQTPAEAIKNTDAAFLTVMDAKAVRELLFSDACKAVLSGKYIANVATIGADEIVELAKDATALGANMAEYSIKSDAVQVRALETYAFLACTPDHEEFWKGIVQPIGEVLYVGNTGAAATAVTLNIMEGTLANVFLAYAFAYAQKESLPREVVERAVASVNPAAKDMLTSMFAHQYHGFATLDGFRDTTVVALNALKAAGLPTAVFDAILAMYDTANKKGYGDQGETALVESLL